MKPCKKCAAKFNTNLAALNLAEGVSNVLPANFPKLQADPNCSKCTGQGYRMSKKGNQWTACKRCAQTYGTNLATV